MIIFEITSSIIDQYSFSFTTAKEWFQDIVASRVVVTLLLDVVVNYNIWPPSTVIHVITGKICLTLCWVHIGSHTRHVYFIYFPEWLTWVELRYDVTACLIYYVQAWCHVGKTLAMMVCIRQWLAHFFCHSPGRGMFHPSLIWSDLILLFSFSWSSINGICFCVAALFFNLLSIKKGVAKDLKTNFPAVCHGTQFKGMKEDSQF